MLNRFLSMTILEIKHINKTLLKYFLDQLNLQIIKLINF